MSKPWSYCRLIVRAGDVQVASDGAVSKGSRAFRNIGKSKDAWNEASASAELHTMF